jgi:hypothetical protein
MTSLWQYVEGIRDDVLKIRKGQIIRGENIKLLKRQQEPWTSRWAFSRIERRVEEAGA